MSDPFADPVPAGDKLPLDELNGSLLLVTVHEALTGMATAFGPSDPVRCDVAVLDGARKGETFHDALIFPRVLAASLRPNIGKMVLGRLGRGVAKAGQSPPWQLSTADAAEREIGTRYLTHVASQQITTPTREEPF